MKESKSDKIAILVVVRHPVGGIRTFLRYVYSRFDTEAYQFLFLLPDTSELDALKENLKEIDRKFIVVDQNAGLRTFVWSVIKALHNESIDLVHSHGFTSMIFSALPAFIYRKPHLLTSHDVFTAKQFSGPKGMMKKLVLGGGFHLVDMIHSVSNDAKDNLLMYFPWLKRHPSKHIVISNGIETERFFIEDYEDWRKQLGLDDKAFLIGFFGRFMAQKGFRFLVEAMDIILHEEKDRVPVVLAFGWGGFIREEQAEINRKGLQDNFFFLPFQENPARAMRGVDVVAMPSLWEAYGLLAAEAMIAGVPIIATDCIGLREVLRDTPARTVPPADSKALADALLAEIRSSSRGHVDAFRDEAVSRFNVRTRAEELQEVIQELSQTRTRQRRACLQKDLEPSSRNGTGT